MLNHRAPIILAGQIYLDEQKNEYIIVTKNRGGFVSYSGNGFRGQRDDEVFIETYPPVDPADVDPAELQNLLSFCDPGTEPKVGFIKEQ